MKLKSLKHHSDKNCYYVDSCSYLIGHHLPK